MTDIEKIAQDAIRALHEFHRGEESFYGALWPIDALGKKAIEQEKRADRAERHICELQALLVLWKLRAGTDPNLQDIALNTAGLLHGCQIESPEDARAIVNDYLARLDRNRRASSPDKPGRRRERCYYSRS